LIIGLSFAFSYSVAANDAASVDFANIVRSTQLLPICTSPPLIPGGAGFNFTTHTLNLSVTFLGFQGDCSITGLPLLWACQGGCICVGQCVTSIIALESDNHTCVVGLSGVFQFNQQSTFVLSSEDSSPLPTFKVLYLTIMAPMIENDTVLETNSTVQYLQSTVGSSPLFTFWKHFVVTRDQLDGGGYVSSVYIWTDPQATATSASTSLLTVVIVADTFFTYNLQTKLLGRMETILFLIVGLIALYEVVHVGERILVSLFSTVSKCKRNPKTGSETEGLLHSEVN